MKKKTVILVTIIIVALIVPICILSTTGSKTQNNSGSGKNQDTHNESDKTIVHLIQTPEEVRAYYESIGNVIRSTPVNKAEELLKQSEAQKMLEERGFGQVSVSCPLYPDQKAFANDGTSSVDATTRYPIYEASYYTEDMTKWHIYINNDQVYAVSAAMNVRNGKRIIYSEQEHILSYDANTDTFYEVAPDSGEQEIRTVDYIDAELLENETSGKENMK